MVIPKYKVSANTPLKYDTKFFIPFDWKFSRSENDAINTLGHVPHSNPSTCPKTSTKSITAGFQHKWFYPWMRRLGIRFGPDHLKSISAGDFKFESFRISWKIIETLTRLCTLRVGARWRLWRWTKRAPSQQRWWGSQLRDVDSSLARAYILDQQSDDHHQSKAYGEGNSCWGPRIMHISAWRLGHGCGIIVFKVSKWTGILERIIT